jgi:acetyl esterase/lipase
MKRERLLAALLLVGLAACAGPGRHEAVRSVSTTTSEPAVTEASTSTSAPPGTVTTTPLRHVAPYDITTTTLALVDTSRPTVSNGKVLSASRTLTTTVWYPAGAAGPWPLVVFAHGYKLGVDPYIHLCQTWAEAGYVVAAPTFPLTDVAVAGSNLDENDINNQPTDVSFVITGVLAHLTTLLDPGRIGVAGHSDGGQTMLGVGFQPGWADSRVRAVIGLSVQPLLVPPVYPFGVRPVLIAQGNQDTINPVTLGVNAYNQLRSPRYLLMLLGAGHLPPFSGGSQWQPVVDRVTIDFLDRYVGLRTANDAALRGDGQEGGLATMTAS